MDYLQNCFLQDHPGPKQQNDVITLFSTIHTHVQTDYKPRHTAVYNIYAHTTVNGDFTSMQSLSVEINISILAATSGSDI